MLKIIPRRKIDGISAVLLPFRENGKPDYDSFVAGIERTYAAGLTPAVNMDTGYVNLLTPAERAEILRQAAATAAGRRFVAGAFVEDQCGAIESLCIRETTFIRGCGGTPILFQATALTSLPDTELVETYRKTAEHCGEMLAFELGTMFAPFGKIYPLSVVEELMRIPQIIGMKHSSLKRRLEWQRLELRDKVRPDFKIYTGNDLAIDMVIYGSDYLLGLSAFAPDWFGRRDALWAAGDPAFYELNDILQYLGNFAFREPVPAYKHSAAQFLKLRGFISSDTPPPAAPRRPQSDIAVLAEILRRLERYETDAHCGA